MNRINNYDNYDYIRPSQSSIEAGYLLASIASGVVMAALPSFSKPFMKQMPKEHYRNHLYKDAFEKSIEQSGLKDKGVKIIHTEFSPFDTGIIDKEVKAGMNAYYSPSQKIIKINKNKASIAGFHEAGHAYNHLISKTGKLLQKCRQPGYAIAGLMGTIALFPKKKAKGEKRNAYDFILDNCGKIAFLAMLPTVIEETMASHHGIKMAKKAGLSKDLIKNLKKFYSKALLSYGGYALVTGLSVYAASKITEVFTRPKKR